MINYYIFEHMFEHKPSKKQWSTPYSNLKLVFQPFLWPMVSKASKPPEPCPSTPIGIDQLTSTGKSDNGEPCTSPAIPNPYRSALQEHAQTAGLPEHS